MKENQPEQKYRVKDWETGKPVDIICNDAERRFFQKNMMKYDGLKGSGRWLEFRPLESVINVLGRIGIEVVTVIEPQKEQE